MRKLTFKELAKKVLEEEKRPLGPLEIWEIAVEKGYDKLIATKGKTPANSIGAQIYVDIRDNPNSPFVKVSTRPVKFFLKSLMEGRDIKDFENMNFPDNSKKTPYPERELHPFLTYFAYTRMSVYTKTIFHEKSKKKKYAQWLHPDMVGVYYPIGIWENEVVDFAKQIGYPSVVLYSFEIKKELGFHNLRESFFQAVSNSSWANEGYLVAADISDDDDLMSELKRLSGAFGIGVIKLDIEDPDASEIVLPARHKNDLDWDTINKLVEENPDFREFILRIKNDLSTKEVIKEKYDRIFNPEDLIRKIQKYYR